jgi:glycosyltransferase involved in cell wall biosynthesis
MLMVDVTGRGGAEKALVDLALHLDRGRFNVSVCATRGTGNYQPLLDAAGVPTFVLGRQTRRDARKLGGLVPLLRRQRVHVLHTHLFGSNTWGRLLGKLAGVPVIITHEHWSSKPRHEVVIDRLLYRLSDRILVASKASKQVVMQVEKIPARHITVAYNGVDTRAFAPLEEREVARRDLGLEAGSFVVGTLGRLTPDKGGQDDLVRAVAGMARKGCAIRLLVVGDGPLRPELERLSAELGLGDKAIFTGTRTGPDVGMVLGCMDVFVLPSHREALPIALLEAMSVGVPVVSTRVGGIPEILEDGINGLLVPAGQPMALQASIQCLADDEWLSHRLGLAGRTHVQANFTLEQATQRVEQVYEEIALKKRILNFEF